MPTFPTRIEVLYVTCYVNNSLFPSRGEGLYQTYYINTCIINALPGVVNIVVIKKQMFTE